MMIKVDFQAFFRDYIWYGWFWQHWKPYGWRRTQSKELRKGIIKRYDEAEEMDQWVHGKRKSIVYDYDTHKS